MDSIKPRYYEEPTQGWQIKLLPILNPPQPYINVNQAIALIYNKFIQQPTPTIYLVTNCYIQN